MRRLSQHLRCLLMSKCCISLKCSWHPVVVCEQVELQLFWEASWLDLSDWWDVFVDLVPFLWWTCTERRRMRDRNLGQMLESDNIQITREDVKFATLYPSFSGRASIVTRCLLAAILTFYSTTSNWIHQIYDFWSETNWRDSGYTGPHCCYFLDLGYP